MNSCFFFIGSSIVFALSLALVMWSSVITANESLIKCSIQDFFVPYYSLNRSSTIFFDLQLDDESNEMGVYYDNLTLTFSYVATAESIIPVAHYTWPGFHQKGGEHGATTHRSDYVTTRTVEVLSKNESSLLEVFRVDLTTAVRFEYWWLTSTRHKVAVRGDVEVNGVTGKKVSQKDVELKPYGPGHHHSQALYRAVFGLSFSFYALSTIVCVISLCLTCARERSGYRELA